ncbi:hypothetical protein ASQ43_04250 [Parasaccharibacter apium]|uniref:DUF2269 domain-containing protein n=1 Tax=Parasaccharibacter apium TaxID=1510841 RepID=A0ABX4ZLZ8_9PROT|nr:hypothetical protein ASQ42_04615 [Parasaccharibacter apium]POS64164.1 hypothetical protein ASO19_03360 [Parasaccharibacter apium]POS64506.1 hypothetical protein ASQ43_04250 [Parasaccharibacter apium]
MKRQWFIIMFLNKKTNPFSKAIQSKPTMEDKRQYLSFIQAIVSRLSDHCKAIKMGTVTFLAGAVAYLAAHPNNVQLSWKVITCYAVIIVVLWILDAYYLRQERLFRKLYNESSEINNLSQFTYKMDVKHLERKVSGLHRIMFSITIWPIYTISLLFLFIFKML